MTSLKAVQQTINVCEKDYGFCWQALANLRDASSDGGELFNFQPRLGDAIQRLDRTYLAIKDRERDLISRKGRVSEGWFRKRMAALSAYRAALVSAREIATDLGDAFIWPFYRRNRNLLVEHAKRPPIQGAPGRVGGIGQHGFIHRVPYVEGHFILHHAVTSLLRLGDVSLVAPDELRITALGELKTVGVNAGRIEGHLTIVPITNDDGDAATFPAPVDEDADVRRRHLPQGIEAKLRRQVRVIVEATSAESDEVADRVDIGDSYHASALRSLHGKLQRARAAQHRVAEDLLLVGIRQSPRRSLAGRLMSQLDEDALRELPAWAQRIVPDPSPYNRLMVEHLGVGVLLGATPLAFWPGPAELIRDIYLRRTFVVALFNPRALLQRLEAEGYRISEARPLQYEARRNVEGGGEVVLENLSYFLKSMHLHLMRADAVLNAIHEAERIAIDKTRELQSGGRVEINLVHHLL